MISIILIIIGSFIGYIYRDLRDSIKKLQSKLPETQPEVGPTPASYGAQRGYVNQDKEIGLVESKTPQQLEWEHRKEISDQMAGE